MATIKRQKVVPAATSAPKQVRVPSSYKYGYLVNSAVEAGFNVGTFTPLTKEKNAITGRSSWIRPHGNGMADVVEYYTDKQVLDDAGSQAEHFALVMNLIEQRVSFAQADAIAVPANSNGDEEVQRAVMELIGRGATTAEMDDAVARINDAAALSPGAAASALGQRAGVF